MSQEADVGREDDLRMCQSLFETCDILFDCYSMMVQYWKEAFGMVLWALNTDSLEAHMGMWWTDLINNPPSPLWNSHIGLISHLKTHKTRVEASSQWGMPKVAVKLNTGYWYLMFGCHNVPRAGDSRWVVIIWPVGCLEGARWFFQTTTTKLIICGDEYNSNY